MKAQLEQLFNTRISRVLDHLVTMEEFDYSIGELAEILDMSSTQVVGILNRLSDFGLITKTKKKDGIKRFKLSDNDVAKAFKKLEWAMAVHQWPQTTVKEKGSEGTK